MVYGLLEFRQSKNHMPCNLGRVEVNIVQKSPWRL